VGEEQTFVRFHGCNLECSFCDEREKTFPQEYTAASFMDNVISEGGKTISFTGGEPLLYSDFLKEVLPALKEKGFKIYLETNGTFKDRLLDVIEYVDVISMDFKLPSSTGEKAFWSEHFDFLRSAVKKQVFVKVVVTEFTDVSDIEKACSIIEGVDKNITFIIQPVSYNGFVASIPNLDELIENAKKNLTDIRVIPQVHKILGVK
jgi:organic radical activating enzyme